MKKKLLIALGSIFSIGLIAVVAVVIYFWPLVGAALPMITPSNIKVLYNALTTDEETSNEKIKENDKKFSEGIKEYIEMDIRDFTEEEIKRIESGEVTETQIIAQIIAESVNSEKATENTGNQDVGNDENDNAAVGENADQQSVPDIGAGGEAVNKPSVDDKPIEQTPVEQKPVTEQPMNNNATTNEPIKTETADQIVARHVAALYELHSDFEARVGALAQNAHNWLHAYKKSNPGITWRDAKVATMQHYMSTATAIESECYAKVDNQVEALKKDLQAIGADLSIVKTVQESAYNEMDIRKAKIVQEGTSKMNKAD